jgi:enoyl-CoA hydratase/carnithine racemase
MESGSLPTLEATRYEIVDRVATITLHRPERLNAWTSTMNAEYRRLLQRASDDPDVRVIVVTGAGRGFCAGAESDDLAGHAERGSYHAGAPDDLATPGYGIRPEFDAELAYHFGIPKPIIAAINGPVAGIGFALSCYCDLRFAAEGAKFTTAHGKLGLPCAFGLAWLLPRLIGLNRAMDLILSSRTFTAEEALTLGLVSATVPPEELLPTALGYAHRLATQVSPASLAVSKRQVYEAFHQSAAESVRTAEALLTPMMGGADYREGVAALREKRPPAFADPAPGAGATPPASGPPTSRP